MRKKFIIASIISSLFAAVLFAQQLSDFGFTEVSYDELPSSISGYVAAACGGTYNYVCPDGYKRTYCDDDYPLGSHYSCSDCIVSYVTCEETNAYAEDDYDDEDDDLYFYAEDYDDDYYDEGYDEEDNYSYVPPYGTYQCSYSTYTGIYVGTMATWYASGWTVHGITYSGGLSGSYSPIPGGFQWTDGYSTCEWIWVGE